ncbi:hypothetical protein [uncultured Desulfovibrio sp.]|uniref:hypothetical protein n=1 Tax=uncultured Desulfovibrio sp. TaxID=167968 RepID=UPI00260F95E6|nr:hypothetical protein [uncultured Desulfovibrio sp.]
MPTENLKADILKRHASVHAFCKAHPELSRSSVYLALSGKYPGNSDNQAARIRATLAKPQEIPQQVLPKISATTLTDTLQEIRCAHCRRLDRRECLACRDQTGREGDELFSRLFGKIADTGSL